MPGSSGPLCTHQTSSSLRRPELHRINGRRQPTSNIGLAPSNQAKPSGPPTRAGPPRSGLHGIADGHISRHGPAYTHCDAVQKANSGHPGTPMGVAPVAYTLWQRVLRFDPSDPIWPNRARTAWRKWPASARLRRGKASSVSNTVRAPRSALVRRVLIREMTCEGEHVKATEILHDRGQSLWLDNITRSHARRRHDPEVHRFVLGDRADLEPVHLRQGHRVGLTTTTPSAKKRARACPTRTCSSSWPSRTCAAPPTCSCPSTSGPTASTAGCPWRSPPCWPTTRPKR